MPAIAVFEFWDESGIEADIVGFVTVEVFEFVVEIHGVVHAAQVVDVGHGEFDDFAEGGIVEFFADGDFLLVEAKEVVGGRACDGVVRREVGLNDYFTVGVFASGAAGNLRDELERFFTAPEVGDGESHVGKYDSDEINFGKMKSDGDHLGSDKDVDFAFLQGLIDQFKAVAFFDGVAVCACYAG